MRSRHDPVVGADRARGVVKEPLTGKQLGTRESAQHMQQASHGTVRVRVIIFVVVVVPGRAIHVHTRPGNGGRTLAPRSVYVEVSREFRSKLGEDLLASERVPRRAAQIL